MSNMLKPIAVPAGVSVEVAGRRVRVKGPLGELQRECPDALRIIYDPAQHQISLKREGEDKRLRSLHGLYRSLMANMVDGVTKGFRRALEVHGTGYSVNLKGNKLVLQVGFCHEVVLDIPPGLRVEVAQNAAQPDNPAKFAIEGLDKERVGQFAAEVRAVRPPEPYKGKGIRYADEYVRRKEGKAFAGIE